MMGAADPILSLPGLTRQSIVFQKIIARVNRAFTPVFDVLCPGVKAEAQTPPVSQGE
jgi:hypothetical protein